MKQVKFYVMISVNGKTVCENGYGYKTREEAESKAECWIDDGFEAGIVEM